MRTSRLLNFLPLCIQNMFLEHKMHRNIQEGGKDCILINSAFINLWLFILNTLL